MHSPTRSPSYTYQPRPRFHGKWIPERHAPSDWPHLLAILSGSAPVPVGTPRPGSTCQHELNYKRWHVVCLSIVSFNCILMAVAEAVLESLIITGMTPKVPFRLEFVFLTMLSAIVGWQAIWGILRDSPDLTKNSLVCSLLLEVSLISSDLEFFFRTEVQDVIDFVLQMRIPFVVVTSINAVLIVILGLALYSECFAKRDDGRQSVDSDEELGTQLTHLPPITVSLSPTDGSGLSRLSISPPRQPQHEAQFGGTMCQQPTPRAESQPTPDSSTQAEPGTDSEGSEKGLASASQDTPASQVAKQEDSWYQPSIPADFPDSPDSDLDTIPEEEGATDSFRTPTAATPVAPLD